MKFLCDNKRHLVCKPYSRQNLHAMAEELGIKRCWFHKHHYDIPKRRIAEIHSKCTVVSIREIVRIISQGRTHISKNFLENDDPEIGQQLSSIGKGSTITDDDRQWLSDLADILYDAGLYTKSIYLDCLLNNAEHCE